MVRRSKYRKNRRSGAVAVLVAICLLPLIGVTAFAIDGGLLIAARRRAQTVADATAYAAACRLYNNLVNLTDLTGLDPLGTAKAAGMLNASANGYTNDGTTNTVQINIPPSTQSKLFQTKPGYAEVIVVFKQPRIFSAVLGSGTFSITARAVARGINAQAKAYSDASLLVLGAKNGSNAIQVSGAGVINAESTIQDNSSNATALNVNGGSSVSAPSIQVTGGYTVTGGSNVSGPVQTAAPTVYDPLAGLKVPDPTTLSPQSFSSSYGSHTISPGVYGNGLSIANGATVTMQPGIYYLQGGGLNIGGGATLTGNGVTIYMDSGAALTLQGGTSVTLTPPTSGTYSGLTYFQNRSSTKPISVTNGAYFNASGTIYAPGGTATINGGTANKYGSQLIVDSLSVSNGAKLTLPTKTDAAKGYIASGTTTASITIVE